MRLIQADSTAAKGWYVGPWNSDLPIAIGYANVGIDEPHVHTRLTEIYIVTRGTSRIRVEQETITLHVGDLIIVEPGEAHTFLSNSPDYFHVVLHTPALSGAEARPDKQSGSLDAWFVEGFGSIVCEPTGILNLNRYFPVALGEVRLTRSIDVLAEGSIGLDVGFSDELTLQIDDEVIFTGRNVFQGMSNDWAMRGYAEPTTHLQHAVAPGPHRLTVILKATEYFGWGLIVNLHGDNFKLLPVSLG